MASKVAKAPLIQAIAKRHYAAAAKPAIGSNDVENTVLPNHMVVTSAPSPIRGFAKVAVAVRAGSRYETADNLGVSHILRSSCGLSTKTAQQFIIGRELGRLGSTLSATSDRETIIYNLDANIENLEESLKLLKSAITCQEFRPWELNDNINKIKIELAAIPGEAIVLDLLHKAAYRNGLGNSIFVKDFNINNIGSETLQHFVNQRFQSNKMAVAGVGTSLNTLIHFGESLGFPCEGGSSAKPSQYKGGEVRVEGKTNNALVAIAAEAPGLNKKDVFAYAVLREALGGGAASIKYGNGLGPLSKAVSKSFNSPTLLSPLSIAHSDSGLVGVLISGTPESVSESLPAVMSVLKENLSDEDIARGKAKLKAKVLYGAETADGILTDIANQAALLGGGKSPVALISEIDGVSSSQVKDAQRCLSGKLSMAAFGNIGRIPYLDEL